MCHEEGGVVAGHLDRDAVDRADADLAAAQGLAGDRHLHAVLANHVDRDGVGMKGGALLVGGLGERELQPLLLRKLERVAHADVVGRHAQDARDERTVAAVPVVGVGEGVVELKVDALEGLRAQGARDQCDAQRARGVRRGRADHDGAQNLER